MAIQMEMNIGNITIKKDVIAYIVRTSASECYGLVGMASATETGGFANKLKRENTQKGVIIDVVNNMEINIDLYVIVQFGTKLSVVAKNIIDTVKYNVENQTGLKVLNVNLHIEGVRVQ